MTTIADRIRKNLARLIEKDGRDLKAISKAAGLGETAVRDILQGRSGSPRIDTLEKIAGALKIDLLELLTSPEGTVDGLDPTLVGRMLEILQPELKAHPTLAERLSVVFFQSLAELRSLGYDSPSREQLEAVVRGAALRTLRSMP